MNNQNLDPCILCPDWWVSVSDIHFEGHLIEAVQKCEDSCEKYQVWQEGINKVKGIEL